MADVTKNSKTFYIIDGHAQIFRAYHAIRSLNSPVTNEPTNATFGFVGMLLKLFRECKPDYVAVAIDVGGDKGTFRGELDPQYKANRTEAPDDFHPQVERIVEICRLWGLPVIGIPGFEADDVIATLCTRHGSREGLNIRIVSRDKDLQQLLTDRVSMYDIHTGESMDVVRLQREKGVTPVQVADVLALMGDTADNIPGAHGVGPKTAAKLIAQYGTLDNLLQHTDELTGKLKENIEAARERFPLNLQLVGLRHDVEFALELSDAAVRTPPYDTLQPIFKQLGFNRHLDDLAALSGKPRTQAGPESAKVRIKKTSENPGGLFAHMEEEAPAPSPVSTSYRHADPSHYQTIRTAEQLDELVEVLRKHTAAGGALSVDTETDRLDPMQARLCGVCLSWKPEQGVYIPVRSPEQATHLDEAAVLEKLRPLLEDPAVVKVGHNLKYDMLILRNAGVNLAGVGATGFDTMVASYLIDATRTSHKLDNLALALLGHEMIPISDLIGKGKTQKSMIDVPVDRVTVYGAEDADISLRLYELFAPQLRVMGLMDLFRDLEMPLVEVLTELEFNGIVVDPDELDKQKKTMDKRIEELRDQIAKAAGADSAGFNPDSPKQLADVLFKKMGATVVKRTKTGASTDSEVLERIAEEQPPPQSLLATLILEYRQLTKLRGTYLQSLKEAINPRTRRIHASFHQTVAATGRLSSSDPNLQNIPIRTEVGRQIRKAFVAPPGHVLLGADYSQVELRILAHLSQDAGLIEAFEKDMDIHTAVAAQVFGVPVEQVTGEQRGTAKMVNFGIVYGVTPYGLARRLPSGTAGSSVEVAKQIIADYKKRYPKIDRFLARCVETAETKGYVQTICGRRRAVPDIKARNANMVSLARRIAINTVVQGSAADLIKIAMVRLHRRIREENRPMKMLLQIHDELVFEVPKEHVETEAEIVRREMRDAMQLTVPLKVDTSWGGSWYDA